MIEVSHYLCLIIVQIWELFFYVYENLPNFAFVLSWWEKIFFFRQLPQHSDECSKYFYLKNDTHVYKYLIRNEKTSEHSHFY